MLLKPETRQMFVDTDFEAKACSKLKNDSRDDEFLVSRIIFLTTYGTNIDLAKLIDQHGLADTISMNLGRHVKLLSTGKTKADPMESMALVETLKLLFNVTRFCEGHVSSFVSAVPHLVALLVKNDVQNTRTPLDPPLGPIINALLNLPLDDKDIQASFFPKDEPQSVVMRLIDLLDLALKSYSESELEQTTTPLVCVISIAYEHAPSDVRQSIRTGLLPTEEERQNVLGEGNTLAARLLRNSTNPLAPELRNAISHLFFDISDKDASKFVKNVGYGFASGFLFQNQIPIPEAASEAFNAGSSEGPERPVNPVTGQFLDAESVSDLPEMTDEEKEREAEKLFVLFERLKQTGVMDVQNPVEKAFHEGRFEELPDDYEEEEDDDDDSIKKS
ncbi:guanine nucleotide exchange factor [Podospora didyma]|uniref:Guanine nucleotide exchange factor n=1 Tax=Podospora didyma TaxID=330526 RepID=A0AAE0U7C6_9PEZI|nr:guanine nucleotide exchange factor [Podospora didyma]